MADQDFNINIRTTADTTGAKQTEQELARLQEQAAKQGAEAGRDIGRLIAPFASAFSAFKFIDQINAVADQLKRTGEELAKQGEQLTENALKYQELAKGARDEGDVIKIASSALRDAEAAQRRYISASQEELTIWEKISDAVYHAGLSGLGFNKIQEDAGRISKQALDLRIQGEQQLAEMAERDLVAAIRSSEAYKAAFDKLKAEPPGQAVDELNVKLREQQAILNSIDYTKFPKSWLEASKNVERTKQDLEQITKLQQQAVSQTVKDVRGADPQVQRILMNEQAAATARAAGREQDAEMFQRSADAFRRGARPDQLQQLQNIQNRAGGKLENVLERLASVLEKWQ